MGEEDEEQKVPAALSKLDTYVASITVFFHDSHHRSFPVSRHSFFSVFPRKKRSGILFFLGILMSIGVLDKSGLLKELALFLNNNLPSQDIIATVIGIASALIDNVPLVAATMGMYDLSEYGTDDKLWQLIALCAGTGGSILVIGSASGVALMGLEKVDFLWYTKRVSVGAAVGYFAGIATYLAQNAILTGALIGGGTVGP